MKDIGDFSFQLKSCIGEVQVVNTIHIFYYFYKARPKRVLWLCPAGSYQHCELIQIGGGGHVLRRAVAAGHRLRVATTIV